METAIVVIGVIAAVVFLVVRRGGAIVTAVGGKHTEENAAERSVPPAHSETLDDIFREVGLQYHINPALLKGIAKQESNLGASRQGITGDVGLMQINPVNFGRRPLATRDQWEHDDRLSITVAAEIIADMRRGYAWGHDPASVLAGYNWGPSRVQGLYAKGNFPAGLPLSVQGYIRRVLAFKDGFIAAFPDQAETDLV